MFKTIGDDLPNMRKAFEQLRKKGEPEHERIIRFCAINNVAYPAFDLRMLTLKSVLGTQRKKFAANK